MSYSENPAEIDVTYLKGVGPQKAEALRAVGIETVDDLLHHFPRRYLDRSKLLSISQLTLGAMVTVVGRVRTHGILRARKNFLEVLISDDTGTLPLIWFSGIKYYEKRFKKGMVLSVSGTVTDFKGLQIVHPEIEVIFDDEEEERMHTGRLIPLYPSTEALKRLYLDSRGFRRIIKPALDQFADKMEDIVPQSIINDLRLPTLADSIRQMHYPDSMESRHNVRQALALRELLLFQLQVADRRRRTLQKDKQQRIIKPDAKYLKLIESLPFKLTSAQNRSISEICADLYLTKPMQRLLQGDVGSGKTVIAALIMALVSRSGYQSALMSPTEILAQQHYRTITSILEGSGIEIELLTGSTPPKTRQGILAGLSGGTTKIAIGTHALISEDVSYKNLALVVVDEQHRFGVSQREALLAKGESPDLLVMTATPIPRTLALTAYGDLDISIVDEMPVGRIPVKTALRTEADRPKIYAFIQEEVKRGNQVFIIFPLVEESLKTQLKAAKESYQQLQEEIFPELELGLVHGQMKKEARDEMMERFKNREISIMLATTVVEVGIDIPDATVILIEHAERFGLSQLHQLRGRVGRSNKKSYCILMTELDSEHESYKRLEKFVECTDGFKIAELDLELRGPGDLLGKRQSGMPEFHVADLASDLSLILTAREYAHKLIENKVQLTTDEKTKLNSFIKHSRSMEKPSGVS